jgi:propanol-preferring alcohol dehydrogenase
MKAIGLNRRRTRKNGTELPDRQPDPGEVRVKALVCGVCRTDRDDLANSTQPLRRRG